MTGFRKPIVRNLLFRDFCLNDYPGNAFYANEKEPRVRPRSLMVGVCDGIQPVISYQNGAGDKIGKRKTITAAVWILIGLAAAFSALTPAMIAFLPKVFDVSSVAEEMMKAGLKIYALSYVLKAAVKFICAYCYSVRQKVTSDILTYLDPAVFTPLFLFVLSSVAGLNGVWWSVVCAQAAVCVAAAVIFAVRRKCKNV